MGPEKTIARISFCRGLEAAERPPGLRAHVRAARNRTLGQIRRFAPDDRGGGNRPQKTSAGDGRRHCEDWVKRVLLRGGLRRLGLGCGRFGCLCSVVELAPVLDFFLWVVDFFLWVVVPDEVLAFVSVLVFAVSVVVVKRKRRSGRPAPPREPRSSTGTSSSFSPSWARGTTHRVTHTTVTLEAGG